MIWLVGLGLATATCVAALIYLHADHMAMLHMHEQELQRIRTERPRR